MRISDWSSDVCSSDLLGALLCETAETRGLVQAKQDADCCDATTLAQLVPDLGRDGVVALIDELIAAAPDDVKADRKRVVLGKSVSVRGGLGGRRVIQNKIQHPMRTPRQGAYR